MLNHAVGQPLVDTCTILVVDQHAIYRRGVEICLNSMPHVDAVIGVTGFGEALSHAAMPSAKLVIVDVCGPQAIEFIRDVRERFEIPTLVCTSKCDEETILAVVEAGACGVLAKEALTPERLCATVEAVLQGAGVMSPELLGRLLSGISRVSRDVLRPRGLSLSRLTAREQQVLRLVADGRATREVALELCYSERTVKNILHDVVVKLGVRSRSHAVAYALRHELI